MQARYGHTPVVASGVHAAVSQKTPAGQRLGDRFSGWLLFVFKGWSIRLMLWSLGYECWPELASNKFKLGEAIRLVNFGRLLACSGSRGWGLRSPPFWRALELLSCFRSPLVPSQRTVPSCQGKWPYQLGDCFWPMLTGGHLECPSYSLHCNYHL